VLRYAVTLQLRTYLNCWTKISSNAGRCTILFSPKRPDQLWGPSSLLPNGYRGFLPVVRRPVGEVDTHLHLVPSLRRNGVKTLLLPVYIFVARPAAILPVNCYITHNTPLALHKDKLDNIIYTYNRCYRQIKRNTQTRFVAKCRVFWPIHRSWQWMGSVSSGRQEMAQNSMQTVPFGNVSANETGRTCHL
jgi:hypothetical protein